MGLDTHVHLHFSAVEAHSSEQKTVSSPRVQSVQNFGVVNIHINIYACLCCFLFFPDEEIQSADAKETAIADHEETGDQSGVSTHAPLSTESEEKGSSGIDLHGEH